LKKKTGRKRGKRIRTSASIKKKSTPPYTQAAEKKGKEEGVAAPTKGRRIGRFSEKAFSGKECFSTIT